tara:strand:+ start:2215 stop:3579 length:1365 start_codon:yes stop_codon:yes gene_type:complete
MNEEKISEKILIVLIMLILVFLYYMDTPLRNFLRGKEKFTGKRCGKITTREINNIDKEEVAVEPFENYLNNDDTNKLMPLSFMSGTIFGEFAPFNEQPDHLMGPMEIPKMEIINSLQSPPPLPETQVRVPKFKDTRATSREQEIAIGEGPIVDDPNTPEDELAEANARWREAQWGKRPSIVTPTPISDVVDARKKKANKWYGQQIGPIVDDPNTPEDELAEANARWREAQGLASRVTPAPSDALFHKRVAARKGNLNNWLDTTAGPIVDDPDTPEDELAMANAAWRKSQGIDHTIATPTPMGELLEDKLAARRANMNKWGIDGGGPIVDDPDTPEDELAMANAAWRKSQGFDKIPPELEDHNRAELDDIISNSLTPYPMSPTMPPFEMRYNTEDTEVVPMDLDNQENTMYSQTVSLVPELEYDYIGTPPPFEPVFSTTPYPMSLTQTPEPFFSI